MGNTERLYNKGKVNSSSFLFNLFEGVESAKDIFDWDCGLGPGSQKDRYRGTAGTKEGLSPTGRFRS